MNKKEEARLRKVIKKLRELPKKRFYFGRWVGEDWEGKQDLSCGTSACALGWATTLPSIRRMGLRLVKQYGTGDIIAINPKNNKEEDKFEACRRIFGIEEADVFTLFYPVYSGLPAEASPKKVARNIEKFIDDLRRRERIARKAAADALRRNKR